MTFFKIYKLEKDYNQLEIQIKERKVVCFLIKIYNLDLIKKIENKVQME